MATLMAPLTSFLLLLLLSLVFSQNVPQFLLQPGPLVVREGTTVTLNCRVDSNIEQNLTYSWTVNDLPIYSTNASYTIHSNNSLSITGFSAANNDGNYTCWVTNGSWIIRSRTAVVQQAFVQSDYESGSTTVYVAKNNYTILDCIPGYDISNPTGNPSYVSARVISWLEGGRHISIDTEKIKNSAIHGPNGRLYLRHVTETGDYECRVENTVSQGYVRYTTYVRFQGQPIDTPSVSLLSQPTNMIANVGDTVVMSCITSSSSSVITWSGPEGITIPNTLDDSDEVIVLPSVGHSHEGTYSCNTTDVSGTFSATLSIRDHPTVLTTPPSTNNVLWGTSVDFTCSANGTSPLQWAWFHNGNKIGSSSSLTLPSVGLSHSGAYQCFVYNLAGFDSRNIHLNVHTIPPSFTPDGTLSNQLGFSGSNFTLTCKASGTPLPNYNWKRNQTMITTSDTQFDFTTKPGSLVFKSLAQDLQGSYTCIVRSSIGTDLIGEVSSTGEVYVASPTIFTSEHHSHFSPYVGESFSLNCSVSHDTSKTSVRLRWTFNGTDVVNTRHTRLTITDTNITLFINSSVSTDHGIYQCHAETIYNANNNLRGPTIHSEPTLISVTAVPSSPTVTNVALLSSTFIEVYWTYPGFTDNIQSFRIDTKVNNSEWVEGSLFTQSSLTRRNVTVLPYTVYSVRVVVILRNGVQVESPPFEYIRTLEDVPSTPPLNLRAVSRSKTDVSLYWDPPSIPNGVITDYTLSFWTHRDSTPRNITIRSNMTTYALLRLQGSTMYLIVIAAHTSVGRGPFSSPVNITTDPTIGGVDDGSSQPIEQKIWFIFVLCIIGIIIIVTIGAVAAAIRWNKKRKGHKYPVRNSFHAEEADFSPDVVADYEKRKKIEPINALYMEEGEESVSSQTTIPPSFTYATYASSTDGGGGGSIRLGVPVPPSYINPPSFEDTLKSRLNRRRSASMSLLEKAEHLQLSGSGWSVGHDPKSAFFMSGGGYDDTVDDDSIEKKHLHLPDDLSGGSSDSRLQSNTLATRSGSLATFV